MEMISIHPKKEMEVEADRSARRKMGTQRSAGKIPFTSAKATAAAASNEMGCREEELKMRKEKPKEFKKKAEISPKRSLEEKER